MKYSVLLYSLHGHGTDMKPLETLSNGSSSMQYLCTVVLVVLLSVSISVCIKVHTSMHCGHDILK